MLGIIYIGYFFEWYYFNDSWFTDKVLLFQRGRRTVVLCGRYRHHCPHLTEGNCFSDKKVSHLYTHQQ